MYPKYAGNIARVPTIIVDVTDRPGTHLKFDVFNNPQDKLRFMKMFSPEYAVESVNLLERKMADLYHSTDIENLPIILKSGALVPKRNEYVSLSRDKNYNFASLGTSGTAVFVVDQARLVYNHKIQPFDWHMSDEEDPEDWARDPELERRKESEERVKGPISLKFVKEIWLPKSLGLKQLSSTKKILDNIRQLGISVQFVTEDKISEDYRDAARLAAERHKGQTRDGGKPYISHPVRVANLVRKFKDSKKLDELLSAAFLHDTIEDTDTTEEQLRKMFGDLVATLVKELTSDKEKIEKLGKAEYLTQKMINMSSWGLVIKLADRLDNVADIKTAKTPEWRHRYREETESILSKLEQSRQLSGTHQNIIAAIRGKLAEIDESPIREAEEENVKPLVYLDMDGVLADFFGEWSRISGVNHYKDIDNVEAKLQLVRDHPTFWVDLPMLPHAKALIQTVVKNYGEYRICSKPLEGDTRSEPGKLQWIKKHLSDMPPADIILTADKARFAKNDGYPNILVDDYGVNINSWKAAGGIGIKYEDQSFDKAARVLQSLARSGVSK
jgi:5'(3')-deoxyribonucleotidase